MPPEVKYVILFGVQPPALGTGRDIGLAFSGFFLLCYLLLTLYELYIDTVRRRRRRERARSTSPFVVIEDAEGSVSEVYDKEDDASGSHVEVNPISNGAATTYNTSSRTAPVAMYRLDSSASDAGYGGPYAAAHGAHTLSVPPRVPLLPTPRTRPATSTRPPARHNPSLSTTKNDRPLPSIPVPGSSASPPGHFSSPDQGFSIRNQPSPRPRTHWRDPAEKIDPMFIGILSIQLVFFVYFVVNTERLLTVNPSTGANSLSFGQVSRDPQVPSGNHS